MHCAKNCQLIHTAEPIEMPLWGLTHVGPLNRMSRDWLESLYGQFCEAVWSTEKHRESDAVYAAKRTIIQSSITACSGRGHSVLNNCTTCDAAFRQNSWTSILLIAQQRLKTWLTAVELDLRNRKSFQSLAYQCALLANVNRICLGSRVLMM